MLTGEFEFDDYFQWENTTEGFGSVSAQILFVVFLIFVSVVIANLLIGLTISQTAQLTKEAGIFRLEAMVQLITKLENTTKFNKIIHRFLGGSKSQMYHLFGMTNNKLEL